MSIKTDAYSILKFIIGNRRTNHSEIMKYFEFGFERTIDALIYLEQKDYITAYRTPAGQWHTIEPTAKGIDLHEELEKQEKKDKKEEKIRESKLQIQKDTLGQISRIETSLNFLLSRQNREITYKSTLYPLLIASFVSIGFTSFIEVLRDVIPKEYSLVLTNGLYVLMLISIVAIAKFYNEMKINLDVDEYFALLKIKNESEKFKIMTKIRKIFEDNDHQFEYLSYNFEGFLINGLLFWMKSKGTDINRKEEIIKTEYDKKIKKIIYNFNYINRRNIFSSFEIDFKNLKVRVIFDRGADFNTANNILKNIGKLTELEIVDKSGWDY